ncbi:reverse transcriptase family protein [Staphylococcus aureus]
MEFTCRVGEKERWIDLKSGYWQVGLHPEDKEKTVFSTGEGLWQFTVMPFGLCNAPATFERLMEQVLKGLNWKTCLVYLDDIIIIGKTVEDHLNNLREVFQRLKDAGMRLSPKKCSLFEEVKYLVHIVSEKGISTDRSSVENNFEPERVSSVSSIEEADSYLFAYFHSTCRSTTVIVFLSHDFAEFVNECYGFSIIFVWKPSLYDFE